MEEEQKREVAIFRFGVIHDLVVGSHLERGDQQRLLREKCERKWVIPHSSRTRLTRGTILRWVQRYKQGNGKLESLYPTERSDRGISRGLDEESSLALIQLRRVPPDTCHRPDQDALQEGIGFPRQGAEPFHRLPPAALDISASTVSDR